jgi:hypothetical protein
MSEQSKDGGPAFPNEWCGKPGMSLRDYIATNVDITGCQFSNVATAAKWAGIEPPQGADELAVMTFGLRVAAVMRYALADAMLLARSTPPAKGD